VGQEIEPGLREVAQAGQADYQAVDRAEGGEAEDFGGVVAFGRSFSKPLTLPKKGKKEKKKEKKLT